MKTTPRKTERIHSLDSLRAIMMMLGLVFHSALTYSVMDFGEGWPIKDIGATHVSNDFIFHLIHRFRIPVFFLVAGFFGAMLFYERTPLKMIKNRVSRIMYPFIVFLFLLWPTIIFSFAYTKAIFAGSSHAFTEAMTIFSDPLNFIPKNTSHLWFLYYLILITAASVLLGIVFKKLPKLSATISKAFNWIIQKPILRVFVFTLLTCFVYLIIRSTSFSGMTFRPYFNTFVFHFFFYIVGWVFFKSKHLLNSMMRLDWICTILGFILTVIYFFNINSLSKEYYIAISSLTVWLFIFGITGLFIRFGSNHSLRMRYISDASYWVYLIHFPLTAILPSFLINWNAHASIKFLTVLILTTFICFVTYHYFVRNSFIGKFLNGRKYSRKRIDNKTT
jgi:peptidoglycan/LPS O-acetylase OafA/YrhL